VIPLHVGLCVSGSILACFRIRRQSFVKANDRYMQRSLERENESWDESRPDALWSAAIRPAEPRMFIVDSQRDSAQKSGLYPEFRAVFT
jgi:hypothetical protein